MGVVCRLRDEDTWATRKTGSLNSRVSQNWTLVSFISLLIASSAGNLFDLLNVYEPSDPVLRTPGDS